MRPITVLLAEDHHLVREALRALLEENKGIEVVGQAEDGFVALELAASLRPDIVVMDISMPNLNGLEATARMRGLPRPPGVIILSQHSGTEYVVQALVSGAKGYLLKDSVVDDLTEAITVVFQGETYLSGQLPQATIEDLVRRRETLPSPLERLTPREREVLQLVAEGNTNRQIASKLSISVKTVEKHRFNLMEKLGIRDVTGLVRFAVAHGIVTPREG
jgi:RNA polymerase sigma factor (sigma-70 family)